MKRLLPWACAALFSVHLASCAQATQIVLVVDSDLDLTQVDIDVSSSHSPPSRSTADFSMPATPSMPLTLAIYPRGSADIGVFVTVIGTIRGGSTIQRDVSTRFVPGSSRMLRVLLAARCTTTTCAVGQTCDETGCRAIAVPGEELPEWTGSAPSLSGMAACAAVDELCNGRDDDCDMRADESFDLATDTANCGACGHACASGACTNGSCDGEEIAHLSAGGAHTCAASTNGALTCWGWNDQDQLGSAELETNSAPTLVAGVTGVTSLATGALHTCTIDSSGRCGCFGEGMDGALGRGTTLDAFAWAPVTGTTTYTSVAAGVNTTCAIDASHGLSCWGANDRGQLGNGTATPSSMPAAPVLDQVASVALGYQHACAVRMDGTLWCWGANDRGQCGSGIPVGPGAPVQVPGVSDASAVACGRAFTCVLHASGIVECMGDDAYGQLGDGGNTSSAMLVRAGTLSDVRSLSAPSGGTHVCAVRATGLLACWGGNTSGQLGDGTTLPQSTPVMVAMPSDVAAVATGGLTDDGSGHTCVLDREGRVWCWGDGSLGQLGTRSLTTQAHPVMVIGAM